MFSEFDECVSLDSGRFLFNRLLNFDKFRFGSRFLLTLSLLVDANFKYFYISFCDMSSLDISASDTILFCSTVTYLTHQFCAHRLHILLNAWLNIILCDISKFSLDNLLLLWIVFFGTHDCNPGACFYHESISVLVLISFNSAQLNYFVARIATALAICFRGLAPQTDKICFGCRACA